MKFWNYKMPHATKILLFVAFNLHAQNALIWTPNNVAQSSAQAIQSALLHNGVSAQSTASLCSFTLNSYDYIFVCLGLHPGNYVLNSSGDLASIEALVDYMNNGGRLYMEGGDTWARDEHTELHSKFYIRGEGDGKGDLLTIHGAGCFNGRMLSYDGANSYIDRLAPRDGATVFFTNSAPAYACGVGYENGTYRALGVSFEFGGLFDGSDTKAELMADILTFFESGCLRKKPAPGSLFAYSGYDNRVPLVWSAPPGQTALSDTKEIRAPLVFQAKDNTNKIKDHLLFDSLIQPKVRFYQADSYNIYRSEFANGPFAKIASNVERQYYNDATASNDQTWHYAVTAQYSSGESDFSLRESARPVGDGFSIRSPWAAAAISFDGVLGENEWANSFKKSITNENISRSVVLYIMNDDNYLYLGIDDKNNTDLAIDDQIGIYFDGNNNGEWPPGSLSEEGNFWFSRNESQNTEFYRGIAGHWPMDLSWSSVQSAEGAESAASYSAGHVQYEIKIDLQSSRLNAVPGESIGLFLYSLDMPDFSFTAAWPRAVKNTAWEDAWLIPALFGEIELGQQSDCQFFSDNEEIAGISAYLFNENQDGHEVEVVITSVSGAGDFYITQHNCLHPDLPGADVVPLFWSFEVDELISDFNADVSFHYTESDAAGFAETEAFWGIAWFNDSANAWNWKAGDVDPAENRITIYNVSQTGKYVLFRRIFGDSNGDGYVDEADLQHFADVWLNSNVGEFEAASNQRFHNYNKNTNAAGEQIIDEGDLQVFSDNWLAGIQP